MHEQVALSDIEPNPHRRLSTNPLRPAKLDQLEESLRATNLWPRLMGRRKGNKVQLCYGHHLLGALLRIHPASKQIEVEIRPFSDAQMLQIMCRENMAEWSTDALTLLTTMQATLDAFDAGQIELEKPKHKSQAYLTSSGKEVTTQTAADFLGWLGQPGQPARKVVWTLRAIELIREGELTEAEFAGLTDEHAYELVAEITRRRKTREFHAKEAESRANRAKDEAARARSETQREEALRAQRQEEARARDMREHSRRETRLLAQEVGSELREGRIGKRQIREKAAEVLPADPFGAQKTMPNVREVARSVAAELEKILTPADQRWLKLDELIRYRNHIDPISHSLLTRALEYVAGRATEMAKRLSQPLNNGQGQPAKSAGPRTLKS